MPVDISAFRPEEGTTLIDPPGEGPGHWVGAASLVRDPAEDRLLLAYRVRRPQDRGHRCVVAELTDDGVVELWSTTAEAFGSVSIERPALTPTPQGGWRLYVSYVEPVTGRWQIDLLEADAPDAFDPTRATPVLAAASTGTEGVKDPAVLHLDGIWFLFVNAVEAAHPGAEAPHHGEGGDVVLPTGLATSLDGRRFAWQGTVLPAGSGWDARMARLTCAVPLEHGHLAFYDGRDSAEQNFEEHLGLAWSTDFVHWLRLTPDAAWCRSPHGGGALRYLDAVVHRDQLHLVYEYARPDGSHELRLSRLPWRGAERSRWAAGS